MAEIRVSIQDITEPLNKSQNKSTQKPEPITLNEILKKLSPDEKIFYKTTGGLVPASVIFKIFKPEYYITRLSPSLIYIFNQCPNLVVFSYASNLSYTNPYLVFGSKLHYILQSFYYNIASPLPDKVILSNSTEFELSPSPSNLQSIKQYFYTILMELKRQIDLKETLQLFPFNTSTILDLLKYADITLEAFAEEEAIRYLTTPPHLFKPLATEYEIFYDLPHIPIPIHGFIDVILPSPNPSERTLILKDYKNRRQLTNKQTEAQDILQGATYTLAIIKEFEIPLNDVSTFIFKNIHGNNAQNHHALFSKKIYPILPEHSIKITKKRLLSLYKIYYNAYNKIMNADYSLPLSPDDCPNKNNCALNEICLANIPLSINFIKTENNQQIDNSPLILSNIEQYREGELIKTKSDGFFPSIEDYLYS